MIERGQGYRNFMSWNTDPAWLSEESVRTKPWRRRSTDTSPNSQPSSTQDDSEQQTTSAAGAMPEMGLMLQQNEKLQQENRRLQQELELLRKTIATNSSSSKL